MPAPYRDVRDTCQELSITPTATMHHVSNPRWLMGLGSGERPTVPWFLGWESVVGAIARTNGATLGAPTQEGTA